jgi:hypothetical protein
MYIDIKSIVYGEIGQELLPSPSFSPEPIVKPMVTMEDK